MKSLFLSAGILALFVVVGCSAGGDAGDPNVGATPGPPASTLGNPAGRPGTPGGPALKAAPPKDPLAGRSGAAAGQ